MPEQALGGIPLGLGLVVKINLLNFHIHVHVHVHVVHQLFIESLIVAGDGTSTLQTPCTSFF